MILEPRSLQSLELQCQELRHHRQIETTLVVAPQGLTLTLSRPTDDVSVRRVVTRHVPWGDLHLATDASGLLREYVKLAVKTMDDAS